MSGINHSLEPDERCECSDREGGRLLIAHIAGLVVEVCGLGKGVLGIATVGLIREQRGTAIDCVAHLKTAIGIGDGADGQGRCVDIWMLPNFMSLCPCTEYSNGRRKASR